MSDVIVPDPAAKLECATMYINRGWKVFVLGFAKTPLPNCSACNNAGPEHDKQRCTCLTCHGFYAATGKVERVDMMLTLYPNGHLAVRTGEASGFIAIDAEGDSDGDLPSGLSVLDNWETWVGPWTFPDTLTAVTPSGGVHKLYKWIPGVKSRNRVLPGIDVKSDKGYIVVPCGPGDRYWLNELDVADPSDELINWLRTANSRTVGGPSGFNTGYDYQAFVRDGCPGGHRDEFFNDMCFRLRKVGASIGDAELEIRKHWEKAAQPPEARWYMPWDNVEYKIKRVWEQVAPDDDLPKWRPTSGQVRSNPPPPPPLPPSGPLVDSTDEPVDAAEDVPEPPNIEVNEPDQDVVGPNEFNSDTGNAMRYIRLFGENIRYIPEMKRWLIWNENRWATDSMGLTLDWTTRVTDDIRQQALLLQDTDDARALGRWALSSESLRSRKAMRELAGVDSRVAIGIEQMDRNPWLFVVHNGVLDLRTQALEPGKREDLNTRSANVIYDPSAECPRWREHIKFVTKNNFLLAAYLQRAIGYSLTGLVKEQAFFMLEGPGSNGKNAFIEPVIAMMGDYAKTGTSALLTGGDEQHPTILADLIGRRLVFVDEARQGKPINVERVKQLTGSKRVNARRMGQDFFEFDAQLKLWIAGNNHPTMRDPSDGVWRRLHRILFKAKVAPSKKIGDYGQLLFDEEASGILNWALDGLRGWQQLNGLGRPDEVEEATKEVQAEEDFVGQFLEEVCIVSHAKQDKVTVNELYIEFCMWCTLAGIKMNDRPGRSQFGRDLSGRGFERFMGRVDGTMKRGFMGIRVARNTNV